MTVTIRDLQTTLLNSEIVNRVWENVIDNSLDVHNSFVKDKATTADTLFMFFILEINSIDEDAVSNVIDYTADEHFQTFQLLLEFFNSHKEFVEKESSEDVDDDDILNAFKRSYTELINELDDDKKVIVDLPSTFFTESEEFGRLFDIPYHINNIIYDRCIVGFGDSLDEDLDKIKEEQEKEQAEEDAVIEEINRELIEQEIADEKAKEAAEKAKRKINNRKRSLGVETSSNAKEETSTFNFAAMDKFMSNPKAKEVDEEDVMDLLPRNSSLPTDTPSSLPSSLEIGIEELNKKADLLLEASAKITIVNNSIANQVVEPKENSHVVIKDNDKVIIQVVDILGVFHGNRFNKVDVETILAVYQKLQSV